MRIAYFILLFAVFTGCASKKLPQKMHNEMSDLNIIQKTIPAPGMQSNADSFRLADIDGNHYKIKQIGSQTWMIENLRVTRFMDGISIPYVPDSASWKNRTFPAYCWVNNDSAAYALSFGAFYNWYSVNTGKLCPSGWHVPSNSDWDILTNYLGGADIAGGKLKESDTTNWYYPNLGATNESGFNAIPAGGRGDDGVFGNFGQSSIFWSTDELDERFAWFRNISYYYRDVFGYCFNKKNGFSVRCVKDRH